MGNTQLQRLVLFKKDYDRAVELINHGYDTTWCNIFGRTQPRHVGGLALDNILPCAVCVCFFYIYRFFSLFHGLFALLEPRIFETETSALGLSKREMREPWGERGVFWNVGCSTTHVYRHVGTKSHVNTLTISSMLIFGVRLKASGHIGPRSQHDNCPEIPRCVLKPFCNKNSMFR